MRMFMAFNCMLQTAPAAALEADTGGQTAWKERAGHDVLYCKILPSTPRAAATMYPSFPATTDTAFEVGDVNAAWCLWRVAPNSMVYLILRSNGGFTAPIESEARYSTKSDGAWVLLYMSPDPAFNPSADASEWQACLPAGVSVGDVVVTRGTPVGVDTLAINSAKLLDSCYTFSVESSNFLYAVGGSVSNKRVCARLVA